MGARSSNRKQEKPHHGDSEAQRRWPCTHTGCQQQGRIRRVRPDALWNRRLVPDGAAISYCRAYIGRMPKRIKKSQDASRSRPWSLWPRGAAGVVAAAFIAGLFLAAAASFAQRAWSRSRALDGAASTGAPASPMEAESLLAEIQGAHREAVAARDEAVRAGRQAGCQGLPGQFFHCVRIAIHNLSSELFKIFVGHSYSFGFYFRSRLLRLHPAVKVRLPCRKTWQQAE